MDEITKLTKKLQREIALNRDFVSQEEVVLLSFVHTWQQLEWLGKRFFPRFGLSDAQFNVLMILWDYRETGMRQHELASILMVNRASIGGVIDRMEKQQWVRRQRDPVDRRSNYVHITPAGIALLEKVRPVYYALFPDAFAHLNSNQQQDLLKLLERFRQGILPINKRLKEGNHEPS
ncbi:MAG: MarR family transcriptional regulator [Thioploca sp.]|nr:MarR family transcriptional regulator [Thioploca sp.]